jgi:hypothetical protein
MSNDVFVISPELAVKKGFDIVEGFDISEVKEVVDNYVCAVCWENLLVYQLPYNAVCLVVCPEHGSVEITGRVRNSTVAIVMEKAYSQYRQVIRNLPDLWGELIPPEPSEEKVNLIIKELGY